MTTSKQPKKLNVNFKEGAFLIIYSLENIKKETILNDPTIAFNQKKLMQTVEAKFKSGFPESHKFYLENREEIVKQLSNGSEKKES